MKKFLLVLLTLYLIGQSETKTWCNTDSICQNSLNSKYFCNVSTNICERESVYRLQKEYIYGALLIILISAFANAGGIGGGSVIVPLLTIVFLYDVSEAIPLSKATIFAGAIINICSLVGKRSMEDPNKSLIDYKLCAFMLPLMMAGTFIGVYLNFIIPPMMIIICLTLYLLISIVSIKKKYEKISEKENKELGVCFSDQLTSFFYSFLKDIKIFCANLSLSSKMPDSSREIPVIEINDVEKQLENNFKSVTVLNSNNHTQVESPDELNRNTQICEDVKDSNSEPRRNIKDNLDIFSSEDGPVSQSEHVQIKSAKDIFKDNFIFISILLLSISFIIFLSLLKEGVFFSNNKRFSRCSKMGLSIMLIICVYCLLVSFIAFFFNLKKEEKFIHNCIRTGKNIPTHLKKEFDSVNGQNIDKSFESDTASDLSDNTDYLSFNTDNNTFHSDLVIDQVVAHQMNTKSPLKIDRVQLSKSTKSCKSNITTESIISQHIESKKTLLWKLGGMSFIAGVGSGTLGIGGGMIINPFLILLNYSPTNAMAISSMGVLFTSTISTSEFLIMKAIKPDDLLFFFGLAGIGSLSGIFIIKHLINKFKRPSILILIILSIFILAVVILPTFSLVTIPPTNYFKFGSVCTS